MALADTLGRLALMSIWVGYCKKDLGLMVETVEAGGNDVKNPFSRGDDYICSSDISGGYRVLPIVR